eukprot:CAMPEP_0194260802 /NCGR_PEP_ID=MMETSP0158-20130606/45702_1 /TAXON_ID=33649 /ORGANISM="Thalassionema nitzschioides, Strain L26-B" /LENGTH=440 /DNA_ID=CAMNT_0039000905 /DNA_START=26 /DNA_END=1345 /DNA_ORIENTATION=-
MNRRNQRPANPFSRGGRRLTYSNDPRYGQQTTRLGRRSSGHIVPIFCLGLLLFFGAFSWTSDPAPPPRLVDDAVQQHAKGSTSKPSLDLGYKARLRDNEEEKLPYHKPEEKGEEGSNDTHSNENPKLTHKGYSQDEEKNGDGTHEEMDERFQNHKLNSTGAEERYGQDHDPVSSEDVHASVKKGEEGDESFLGRSPTTNGEDENNDEESDIGAQSLLKEENETSPKSENISFANVATIESHNASTADIEENGDKTHEELDERFQNHKLNSTGAEERYGQDHDPVRSEDFHASAKKGEEGDESFVDAGNGEDLKNPELPDEDNGEDHDAELSEEVVSTVNAATTESDAEEKSDYDDPKTSSDEIDALNISNNDAEINASKNASVTFPENVEMLTNHSIESNESITDAPEAVESNSSGATDKKKDEALKADSSKKKDDDKKD